jgi:hypothetical protein
MKNDRAGIVCIQLRNERSPDDFIVELHWIPG